METKTKAHFTAPELLNPTNPIKVCLIGAGGTGSQVLTGLARMSHSLQQLGHAGFQVSLWDDDVITDANRGRQLFAECEVGLFKATALITRTNRFFGTAWRAVEKPFTANTVTGRNAIYISCVDTAAARFGIADVLNDLDLSAYGSDTPRYWMDFGNSRDTGQVILSTIGSIQQPASEKFIPVGSLPQVTKEFAELLLQGDTENLPSCSLAEALEKQDLFINSVLAQMGCSLLWQLFRKGFTEQRGVFVNLGDLRTMPLPL
ncbi:thiazole biosynthesis adenylyltransferase ThiF [Flavobacterium suaedae]|uniref:Thiazole biosynthesis adenylyltransferase ThiF n=1 Tax=Flavobacterium suaedae TaxID=1767027 RepID=A0ABQ1JB44_9FLAO|nr:PRTRC system ThiF family protein [Flavobacterium suaedae]GGB64236.1 thiazole biosynthesis adenylyltransferase ThiF [Flavobacterium suaedae]